MKFKLYSWILTFVTEIGDFVERDEEIATIETDKVRLFGVFTYTIPPSYLQILTVLTSHVRLMSRSMLQSQVLSRSS